MNATQREAQEIITHVTADLRAGRCEFWQWWEVVHRAMLDGFLSSLEKRNDRN